MTSAGRTTRGNVIMSLWTRMLRSISFRGIGTSGSQLHPRRPRSKFPRPFFRPAFDNNFLVGIKLHSVAPLSVQHAQEAVLPAAEREISHRRRDPDVHAHVAGRDFVTKLPRGISV